MTVTSTATRESTGDAPNRLYSLPGFDAEPNWTVEILRPLGEMPVLTPTFVFVSGYAVYRDDGQVVYSVDTDLRSPSGVASEVALLIRRQSVVAFDPVTGEIHWSDNIAQVTRPQ